MGSSWGNSWGASWGNSWGVITPPEYFTADFISAAIADIRDPRARVQVFWGDSITDFNKVISSNDVNRIDRTGQINNGKTTSGKKWAYIHPGLVADGSFYPMPEKDTEQQAGWYGAAEGDASGNYTTDPYIQIVHDARPYASFTVSGDSEYNEYPVDFTITLTHSGGPTVITVTGNALLLYETTFTAIEDVTAVKLTVSKWSAASTIVKITQFSGALVELYKSGDIVELSILEETNSDSGTVPIGNVSANELDLSLLNTDRRFSPGNTDSLYNSVLLSGRKIKVWLGFVLPAGSTDATGDVTGYIVETEGGEKVGYMPYGVYWSKDWISSHGSMETTTTAYDVAYRLSLIDFLRSENYSGDVGDIIDEVLTQALTEIPDLEWEVSADLNGETWGGVSVKTDNYLEIIKDITEATLSYAYVNRTGVLVVGSRLDAAASVNSYQELGQSAYFDYRSDPKLDELINSVRVGYSLYTLKASEAIYPDDEVFEIPTGKTELKIFISWDTQPVLISSIVLSVSQVSGTPVLTEINKYANGADLTITGIAGETFTITATGTPYEITENTETVAVNQESVNIYGLREYVLTGNQLVSTVGQAQELADALLVYYGDLRQDGSLEWPASTLVAVGDTVEVVEFKSDTVETKDSFIIKRQSIHFDGSLQADAELRRS